MDLAGNIEPCAVCGDKSTGTHYGTISCNGCKGFFRRTILRNQRFSCRFNKQCIIDKNFRCACRYCRFQKCLSAGMKREAIQFERDSMGSTAKKRPSAGLSPSRDESSTGNAVDAYGGSEEGDNESGSYTRIINTLMDMETRVNHEMALRYRDSVISNVPLNTEPTRPCTVDELNEISRTTLLLMVEWAKNLSPFPDLPIEDKIILLKNYAPQHLILMPAFRSPDTTRVCLFNNTYMSRNADQNGELDGFAAFKTSSITPRVLDEIVWPMRQLQMREQEFVCLKALAFLHPEAKGLSTASQSKVREARNRILKALYSIILTHNADEAPTRYGNILLLAPALKALTQLLIENMTLTKFFGLAEVDSLLSEFILDDINDPQSTAPVSIKKHLSSTSFETSPNNNCASTSLAMTKLSTSTVDERNVKFNIESANDLPNSSATSFNGGDISSLRNVSTTISPNTSIISSAAFHNQFSPQLSFNLMANSSTAGPILGEASENTYINGTLDLTMNPSLRETTSIEPPFTSINPMIGQTISTSTVGMNSSMGNFIASVLLNNGGLPKSTSATTAMLHPQGNDFAAALGNVPFNNDISKFNHHAGISLLNASEPITTSSYTNEMGLPLPNTSSSTSNTTTNNTESMLTAL